MPLLEPIFFLLFGGLILIAGGEALVRGAVRMATLFKIPALIIGLTVVAICTGAPEMAVSLTAALSKEGNPDMVVGNVVGSNICNILLILGAAACFRPIAVSSRLVKREIPFLLFVSVLTLVFGLVTVDAIDGETRHFFPQWGGFVFLAILVAYNYWVIRSVRSGQHAEKSEEIETASAERSRRHGGAAEFFLSAFLIVAGLGMLIFGSNLFIDGAVRIARFCGISDLVVGLTVLAVGTSLPELIVSLVAAYRGKNDIAIGNVIGSNTFNLLGILGLSASIVPGGVALTSAALWFDVPMMVASTAIGSFLCFTDRKMTRVEGGFLLLLYVGYVAFLFLRP